MYIYSNEIECFISTLKLVSDRDLNKARLRFTRAYRTGCQGSGCKCYSIWTSILTILSLADRTDLWSYENRFLDTDDPATRGRMVNFACAAASRLRYLNHVQGPKGTLAVDLVLQLACACEGDI